MREPRPVGSAWRAAPTSLYTPGRRDSSAFSIIPARFTRIRVTVSDLISSKGFSVKFLIHALLGVFPDDGGGGGGGGEDAEGNWRSGI